MIEEDFDIHNNASHFDFKGFLLKALSYWPLFLICWAVALSIAYYINLREVPIYKMSNLISIKDDQNPLLTSTTSLVFNWGGTTDKVQTNIVLLKSRTHAEKVVEYLQYYVNYEKQGKYQIEDVYGNTPFTLRLQEEHGQLLKKRITIKDLGNDKLEFRIPFTGGHAKVFNYKSKEMSLVPAPVNEFVKTYSIGDTIDEPFLKAVIEKATVSSVAGEEYFVSLMDFNLAVKGGQDVVVTQTPKGSSVLELSIKGTNKKRLLDYLNASIKVRIRDQLERKNLFATKTIKFIDSSLSIRNNELENVLGELARFKNENSDIVLDLAAVNITEKLRINDEQKRVREEQLSYYSTLESYLKTRSNYSNVPAPSVAGIDEGAITLGVSKIIELSVERTNLKFTAKENNPVFAELDRSIDAEKAVLLENIRATKIILNSQVSSIHKDIDRLESELKRFPKEAQELSQIERRFTLSQEAVNFYLSKKGEANIIKASNVSDIVFIDDAKDVGGGKIGPNNQLNYVLAIIIGGFIPAIMVFLLFFFNTKISSPEEIKKMSSIPIIGLIGKNYNKDNLVVKSHPRSTISESFRGLRSSLQFIYKKQDKQGAKTVLVTSSVSGEGKTFTSMNLASVFALSEKKTVLVGLDLRKPRIFDDFNIKNNLGVVNYLIGDRDLKGVIQPSGIEHLDIILSGPIPPNPSELIIGDRMKVFIDDLKANYDYVILDTPPLGLVADAFELLPYADASLYVVRQGFTKKAMLRMINEKYNSKEIGNISFVLNYFKVKGASGYGYGYGYGAYSNGYHENIEEQGNLLKRLFTRLGYYKKK